MQSYQEFERQQAKEIMEQDHALMQLRGTPIFKEDPVRMEVFLKQIIPEPLVDKAYRLHQEQRKANKKVNLSFSKLAFSVKQQISQDKNGEDHGNVD